NGVGTVKVIKSQGRIYIEPQQEDFDFNASIERLSKVFGIVSVSPVWKVESDFEVIKDASLKMVRELMEKKHLSHALFKVETKRGDKNFPMKSPEVSSELGGYLLSQIKGL